MYEVSRFGKVLRTKKCVRPLALGLVAAALAGCTLDSVIVLKHPASVPKGGTFAVGAVDLILDVTGSQTPPDSIFRDSIHVGVGLPAGWEVLSAKACAAPHFRPAKASINNLDTNLRNQLLLDTLGACEARAFALSEDAGVRPFLLGRNIRVSASPESLGTRFNLRPDTVPRWMGFSGRIEVRVPAGQAADTVVADTSLAEDTTALKVLPVYVYLTLKAPEADTTVRLLYFSKTGPLDTAGIGDGTNQDRGSLVYRPITVGGPVALRSRPARAGLAGLSHFRFSSGHHVLSLPAAAAGPGSGEAWSRLEVRGSGGAVVRSWPAEALRGGASIVWDGTDQGGRALPSSRYVLILSGSRGPLLVRPFPLLR
jgi:hypothetical protein